MFGFIDLTWPRVSQHFPLVDVFLGGGGGGGGGGYGEGVIVDNSSSHNDFLLITVMILQVLSVIAEVSAVLPPYPGDDASTEALINFYRRYQYTANEILGFLLLRHHILISVRTFYRIVNSLGIRLRSAESPIGDVLRAVRRLHLTGYSECGYRNLWRILNIREGLRVTQHTVQTILRHIDPTGVRLRKSHRLRRRIYNARGPNAIIHIDGYDKLKPFGIAIHGAVCGFSRRILWMNACPSNNDPERVAYYFMDYLKENRGLPESIRTDAGTENVIIRSIQIALRMHHQDTKAGYRSAIVGRSTNNQRIEMLWSFLGKSITPFWRALFLGLVDDNKLNNTDPVHLECVRFCFLPVVQECLDTFMRYWNSHRIRANRANGTRSAIPEIMYHQPWVYGTHDMSKDLPVTVQEIGELQDQLTTPMPYRGCGEDFLNLVEVITGINRGEMGAISTPTQAKSLYEAIIEVFDQYDAWH